MQENAAGGAALVTGNPRHFTPVRGTCPVRVVSAREALALFVVPDEAPPGGAR
jgi:hypothetical protein